MTKHFSKIILYSAAVALLAGATGCKCICRENKSAGIPTITCQPDTQEVYLDEKGSPKTATFSVGVTACQPLRFAWFKVGAAGRDSQKASPTDKCVGVSNVLRIENVRQQDRGLYYCVIAQETDGEEGDVYTRTRLAELKVYAPLQAMANPQLSTGQLQGNVPGKNPCVTSNGQPVSFAASLPFPKDAAGQKFMPQGATCQLTLTQLGTSTALGSDEFWVRWLAPTTTPPGSGCTDPDANDTTMRTFTVKYPKAAHTFVVYLKNAAPVGTTFQLSVNWK